MIKTDKKGRRRVVHPFVWPVATYPELTKKYESCIRVVDGIPLEGLFLRWALPILEQAAQQEREPPKEQTGTTPSSQSKKNLLKWVEQTKQS